MDFKINDAAHEYMNMPPLITDLSMPLLQMSCFTRQGRGFLHFHGLNISYHMSIIILLHYKCCTLKYFLFFLLPDEILWFPNFMI